MMEGVVYVNNHDGTTATVVEYDVQEKVYTLEKNYTQDKRQERGSNGQQSRWREDLFVKHWRPAGVQAVGTRN